MSVTAPPPAALRESRVLSFALDHPWAVADSMRPVIANVLARHLLGRATDPTDIAAALQRGQDRPVTPARGAVAIIHIHGLIAPRANLLSDISGGSTFEELAAQLAAAVNDPSVVAIVLDVDSPGGNCAGATEFARRLLEARTKVPIVAVAHYLMASAAYWVCACATEIVAAPSSMAGSIGVFTMHDDITAALEQEGIKREVLKAGTYKAEGMGGLALSDDGRAHLQHLIDSTYARMVGDIALGRGVSPDAIRNGYGQGRVLNAEDALAAGLIDKIETLDDTLARLVTNPARASLAARATAQEPRLAATATAQELRPFATQNALIGALLSLELE